VDAQVLTSAEPVMSFFHRRLVKGRVWPVAVAAFGLYYLGTAFIAWLSGTLYAQVSVDTTLDPIDLRRFLQPLALIFRPKAGDFVPLLSDITHLNFSVLICLIAYPIGYKFIQIIPSEFHRYFSSGAPDVDGPWVASFNQALQTSIARALNRVIAMAFGALAAFTFIMLARSGSATARHWWGHSQFGLAGYYLALGQAVCCYYAMWGFILLVILNRHIRLASGSLKVFHPFHSDGYYGLEPLARLLLWEAVLILLGGIALFSTFYLGYFGLEKSALMLVSMLVFTVGTATVLAWPAYVLTLRVRSLRASAIAAIEPRMQLMLFGFDGDKLASSERDVRDDLSALMRLHDALKSARTVPFGLASLNTVILGYTLQVFILLREFYARFR
jgi:hypothetical protein